MAVTLACCCLLLTTACNFNNTSNEDTITATDDEKLFSMMSPSADLDGDGIMNSEDDDIDGDKLSNDSEKTFWHTNPYSSDTDGDGWDDYTETMDGWYSANTNTFNPCIADVPKLELELTQKPEIVQIFETATGDSKEVSTETSSEETYGHTSSSELSHSSTLTHSWSIQTGLEISWGKEMGGKASVTVGYNGSVASEDSYTYSEAESTEYTRASTNATAYAKENSATYKGGKLKATLKFKNPSSITYIINSVQVTASRILPTGTSLYSGSYTLTYKGDVKTTLAGGGETGEMVFENDDLSIAETDALLSDANGIVVTLSGYTITSTFGDTTQDFTGSNTAVAAKTAAVYIDYGPTYVNSWGSEKYLVGTKVNVNAAATSIDNLYENSTLYDILVRCHLASDDSSSEYNVTQFTDDGMLKSIHGINSKEVDSTATGSWYVTHIYTKSSQKHTDYYSIAHNTADMKNIIVSAGDEVDIIYSIDGDNDGICLSEEKLIGTSDSDTDSDDDGISDYDEIAGWYYNGDTSLALNYTDPTSADTDGDGISDKEDEKPCIAYLSTDASLSSYTYTTSVASKVSALSSFTANTEETAYTMTMNDVASDTFFVDADPTIPASNVEYTFNNVKMTQPDDGFVLLLGKNTLVVTVTALDQTTKKTYTATIYSVLKAVTNFSVNTESSLVILWNKEFDKRASGYVIVRSTSSTSPVMNFACIADAKNSTDPKYIVMTASDNTGMYVDEDTTTSYTTKYYYWMYLYYYDSTNTDSYVQGAVASASGTTGKNPTGTLTVDMLYLRDVKDGESGRSEVYYTITLNAVEIASLTAKNHVSMDDGDDANYYYFGTGATVKKSNPLSDSNIIPKSQSFKILRTSATTCSFLINIKEDDDSDNEGGNSCYANDQEPFVYDANSDSWSRAGKQFPYGQTVQVSTQYGDKDDTGFIQIVYNVTWK